MAQPIQSFDEPRWFACHTKPRCEKKFADLCTREGFENYLPTIKSERKYPDRVRTFYKPLFPSYVFTKILPEHKNRCYQLDLLVRAIWIDDQNKFLTQLDAVKRVVSSGIEATLRPILKKGTLVRITTGPLKGVEGYVEDAINPKGVIIAVDVLQQGLLIPISIAQLKILS